MSSAATAPDLSVDNLLAKLSKRTKMLSVAMIVLAVLFVLIAAGGFFVARWKLSAIETREKELAFEHFVSDYYAAQDCFKPTVDVIWFLHRGYSITFHKVEYTQNGLHLSGEIGNPTHLSISTLALNLSARPYPYKIQEKWEKSDFPWWNEEWNIGTAQTTVGLLNPGSTATFDVTIPNVKQTSDDIVIAVSFSNERYQYLGR